MTTMNSSKKCHSLSRIVASAGLAKLTRQDVEIDQGTTHMSVLLQGPLRRADLGVESTAVTSVMPGFTQKITIIRLLLTTEVDPNYSANGLSVPGCALYGICLKIGKPSVRNQSGSPWTLFASWSSMEHISVSKTRKTVWV